MKQKLIFALASICLVGNVYAASSKSSSLNQRTNKLEKEVKTLSSEVNTLKQQQIPKPIATKTELYDYGSAVTTSPFVGIRTTYDASDLITNLPSMNEDLRILQQRYKLEAHLLARGITPPKRPILELSGKVEGQVLWHQGFTKSKDTSDVNLSCMELDALSEVSTWATGYLSLIYDSLPPMTGSRVKNSRVQISRAFLTFGSLAHLPLYLTIGQIYAPFGDYGSFMTTTPVTQSLGRVKNRAVLIGFNKYGVYASAYMFKGDSHQSETGINQFGANLGYSTSYKQWSVDFGGGIINNIADSEGMQNTIATIGFPGFGGGGPISKSTAEKLQHRVPAFNLHGFVGAGPVSLLAEYVGSLRPFNYNDLNYNGKGARVSALDGEIMYKFDIHNRPISFSAGYGRTWESYALNLPVQSYFARAAISIFRDTIESIEYRHDVNYSKKDRYNFMGTQYNPTGRKGRNIVTFQAGIYF